MKKVRITTTGGMLSREVKGYAYGEWLAHEAHDSTGWRISHGPSGLGTYLLVDDLTPDEARKVARKLSRRIPRLVVVGDFYAFKRNIHGYSGFAADEFRFIFEAITAEELMS